ncbi:MAG: hypothetical protein AVDCRST_MAG68-3766, partial [uncultured Gemmatimonadetes bacterium]
PSASLSLALLETWVNLGMAMAARMPMITTTIMSSIRVKPSRLRRLRMVVLLVDD